MKNQILKKILIGFFFLLVMGLTFYAIFSGESPKEILDGIQKIAPLYLILGLFSALCYQLLEGYKIWFMMDGKKHLRNYIRCIGYSFIEFFYSGITPSASGGQPMQLLYMKKDGYSFSKGCAATTLNATANEFVLAFMGFVILIFWNRPLHHEFGDFIGWFYLGFSILLFWVFVLFFIILNPAFCEKLILKLMKFLKRIHLVKNAEKITGNIEHFFDAYRDVEHLIKTDPRLILRIFGTSFIQRFMLVMVTYWLYRGMRLTGSSLIYIVLIQLAIMIAVDMIPLPGAQGISEYLYHRVFVNVFTNTYVTSSMCASRAASFYFPLIIGIVIVISKHILDIKKRGVANC